MKILSYSPSVEAYVQVVGQDGQSSYYDLSPDIVQATVNRQSDNASTFDITLQNKNWKYNDLLTPMDKVVIYATKDKRQKLITGYINRVSKFTLYQSDFRITGSCSLYRVKKTYWDPLLVASRQLWLDSNTSNSQWLGWSQTITDLLYKVGGWDPSTLFVGEMPTEVVDWAREIYQESQADEEQLKSVVNDFYEVLRSHGPQLSASSATGGSVNISGSEAQQAVCKLYASWEGKFYYSQADGRLDPVNTGYGDCSSTICAAYRDAVGMTIGTYTGDMIANGTEIATGSGTGLPIDRMEPADCVFFNWYGYNSTYDHVELYMGDNKFMGHGGPGNGPYWKDDACAYAGAASDWMVRRYL